MNSTICLGSKTKVKISIKKWLHQMCWIKLIFDLFPQTVYPFKYTHQMWIEWGVFETLWFSTLERVWSQTIVSLRHGRAWVRAPAQAIGSSLCSDLGATNACGYVWWLQVRGSKWLGCHAVYTLIQCKPLLVEKAGVAPDVTLGITASKQERVQARDPLRLWNP